MCGGGVGAHAGPMFTNVPLARALADDRRERLVDDARRHRLASAARRGRRSRRAGVEDTTRSRIAHLPVPAAATAPTAAAEPAEPAAAAVRNARHDERAAS
jgi:hypothetical protein